MHKPHLRKRLPLHILIRQFIWEEHIPGEALRGRGCGIILPKEDPASDVWNWEGGLDLPGEFPSVFHPWDACKFQLPTWHIQFASPPIQPGFNIHDGGLWGVTFPTFLRVWFNIRFPEGHPPLWSRPTRELPSPVQRMTSQVTPTVAMGAGSLHISHPPAQSLSITLKHLSSL